ALENAMSAIGRVFAPALERLAVVVQRAANAIESLSGTSKELIAAFTAGGGLAAVIGIVAVSVRALMRALATGPGLILTLAGAVAGLLSSMEEGKALASGLSEVFRVLGDLFESIARPLVGVIAAVAIPVMKALAVVIGAAAGVVGQLMNAIGPGLTAVAN